VLSLGVVPPFYGGDHRSWKATLSLLIGRTEPGLIQVITVGLVHTGTAADLGELVGGADQISECCWGS